MQAETNKSSTLTPLPPHPISSKEEEYLNTLSKEGRELHELAVKMLGSSYFVERTHGFRKWAAAAAGQKKS